MIGQARPGEALRANLRVGLSVINGIEEHEVRATAVPGLVLNRVLRATRDRDTDPWTVTHYRSGLSLGWATPDPECAMAFAEAIRDVADWTLSGIELRRDVPADAVALTAHRLGLTATKKGPGRGPATDVNPSGAV